MIFTHERYGINRKKSSLLFLEFLKEMVSMIEENPEKNGQKTIEVSDQKMDARPVLRLGKCGGGLHLKLPPELVSMYALETGDVVLVQFKRVQYCNLREVPKI